MARVSSVVFGEGVERDVSDHVVSPPNGLCYPSNVTTDLDAPVSLSRYTRGLHLIYSPDTPCFGFGIDWSGTMVAPGVERVP